MTEFLSPDQAGKLLGVSSHTVRNWIRKGRLAHIQTPGGYYRIPVEEIRRILTPVPAKGVAGDSVMEEMTVSDALLDRALPPALF